MRSCLVLFLLAACELVPAPKQAPPPPPTPAPAAVPVAPPPPAPADAAVAPDAMVVSDACLAVGVKVSNVLIAEAVDASERSALEQQRATIVRRTAEACTTQSWSDDLHKCVAAAKKKVDLQQCEKKYMPKPPAPPAPPNVEVQPPAPPKHGDPNAVPPRQRPNPPNP